MKILNIIFTMRHYFNLYWNKEKNVIFSNLEEKLQETMHVRGVISTFSILL